LQETVDAGELHADEVEGLNSLLESIDMEPVLPPEKGYWATVTVTAEVRVFVSARGEEAAEGVAESMEFDIRPSGECRDWEVEDYRVEVDGVDEAY